MYFTRVSNHNENPYIFTTLNSMFYSKTQQQQHAHINETVEHAHAYACVSICTMDSMIDGLQVHASYEYDGSTTTTYDRINVFTLRPMNFSAFYTYELCEPNTHHHTQTHTQASSVLFFRYWVFVWMTKCMSVRIWVVTCMYEWSNECICMCLTIQDVCGSVPLKPPRHHMHVHVQSHSPVYWCEKHSFNIDMLPFRWTKHTTCWHMDSRFGRIHSHRHTQTHTCELNGTRATVQYKKQISAIMN